MISRCKLAVGLLSGRYSQQPEIVPMETDTDNHKKQKVFVFMIVHDGVLLLGATRNCTIHV